MNVGYQRGCEGKEIFAKNEAAKAVQKLKKEYEDKIKGEGSRIFKIFGTVMYRIPRNFQKLGTAAYRVPRKFKKLIWVRNFNLYRPL